MIKQTLAAAALFAATLLPGSALAVDTSDPCRLVSAVATETMDEIKANRERLGDKSFTRDLVRRKMMPHVDSKYAAFRVLGKHLEKTTKQEREDFTAAFTDYIVKSYAEVMGKYEHQELIPPKCDKGPGDAKQTAERFFIHEDGKQDYEVVFKMRKNPKTGEWKAFDMVAENISMLSTKISELDPILQKEGVGAAIEALRKSTAFEAKR
ncbi:MAG: ABC transporter substrate-binding protein [Succinivibrionaceae bacterium]|nr:ABC transporter substrate-binding protein [Succinivibrionaceae bacterium]